MFQVTNLDLGALQKNNSGKIDFSKDFFGNKTHLTVSGQLEAELGALGLGRVYTLTNIRVENSNNLQGIWLNF